jgi:hypothetical protein
VPRHVAHAEDAARQPFEPAHGDWEPPEGILCWERKEKERSEDSQSIIIQLTRPAYL